MPKKESLTEKSLSGLLWFVLGFVGFSILGVIIFTLLITLGILPAI